MMGAIGRPVVDVQPLRQPSTQQRFLHHRQETTGALGEGELGVRDDAGSVIDERNQVGFAASPCIALTDHARAVEHIGHPQLTGISEGEAASVDAAIGSVGIALVQPVTHEQTMHGRVCEHRRGVHERLAAHERDALADRARRVGLLELQQPFGDGRLK